MSCFEVSSTQTLRVDGEHVSHRLASLGAAGIAFALLNKSQVSTNATAPPIFAPLEGWRHVKVTDHHIAIDYARVLKDLADIQDARIKLKDLYRSI